jgi:NAD(P)H-hydrate epimerase
MKLVTAQQMQEIDRQTIDGGHVPSLTLMENAGRAVAVEALEMLRGQAAPRVEILCGKGNNGGDGLVAARLLATSGLRLRVWLTHPGEELSTDARRNLERLSGTGVDIALLPQDIVDPGPVDTAGERLRIRSALRNKELPPLETHVDFAFELQRSDLCLDALLGTGVSKRVAPRLAAVLNTANRSCRQLLAVDIPSGVDGTSAEIHGTSLWADATVTMGLPKRGLVFHPGAERTGQLHVADIGFPDWIIENADTPWAYMGVDAARRTVPAVSPTAHKYARGAVLVVAGSRAYPGAAALSAEACLRSGAGIVHLVVPEAIRDLCNLQVREVIVHGAPHTADGTLAREAMQVIEALLPRMDAVAIGPGLTDQRETQDLVSRFVASLTLPHVVDADALQAIAAQTAHAPRVVTPHAGELARMTGLATSKVVADRVEVAADWARRSGSIVLCKGAPTVVVQPEGPRVVNGSGNVGLATAGSGDVLTGILAGLLAQGVPAAPAASLAAWLHGRAAEHSSAGRAARCLTAGDLLLGIGLAFRELSAI